MRIGVGSASRLQRQDVFDNVVHLVGSEGDVRHCLVRRSQESAKRIFGNRGLSRHYRKCRGSRVRRKLARTNPVTLDAPLLGQVLPATGSADASAAVIAIETVAAKIAVSVLMVAPFEERGLINVKGRDNGSHGVRVPGMRPVASATSRSREPGVPAGGVSRCGRESRPLSPYRN